MPPLTVRSAQRHDLPALLALYRQLSARNPADLQPAHLEAWEAIQAQPGLHVLVAELGGRVVGTVILALIPNLTRGARPYGVIENVVTDAAQRGQGIGRATGPGGERPQGDVAKRYVPHGSPRLLPSLRLRGGHQTRLRETLALSRAA